MNVKHSLKLSRLLYRDFVAKLKMNHLKSA
jgi:hypothetical protein